MKIRIRIRAPDSGNNRGMENEKLSGEYPRQVVIVCFGTPGISGDALGPIAGGLLREKYNVPAFVYGTIERPVNGKNMDEWIAFIKEVHGGAVIISVDASLGAKSKVGGIIVRSDGVCPAAVKGKKSRFGDVGVLGVVGENKGDPLMELMRVPALYVDELADKVANMINNVLQTF